MSTNNINDKYGFMQYSLNSDEINQTLTTLKDMITVFRGYGAPITKYKDISMKELVSSIVNKNFSQLPDKVQCEYFQELHNRIAKRFRFPAVKVNVIPVHPEGSHTAGAVIRLHPLEYLYRPDGEKIDNIRIDIDNKIIPCKNVMGVNFVPSSSGLENMITIFHESRHVAQQYARYLMTQKNQMLAEEELNVVAYFQLVYDIVFQVTKGKNYCRDIDTDVLAPKIKNKYIGKDLSDVLRTYILLPWGIDARKFAFEQMNILQMKGYLDETNWNTYKGKYLLDEYESLNHFKSYSQGDGTCPTIKFLKGEKLILEANYENMTKILNVEQDKKIVELKDKINCQKYYKKIQDFYNDLKTEIRKVMVEDANLMKKNEALLKRIGYEGDPNIIYKLEYGADQIVNQNYEMNIAVSDKYTDTHIPVSKETVEQITKFNYIRNKKMREDKKKENELVK